MTGRVNVENLRRANQERTRQAGPAQAARVRTALDRLGSDHNLADAEAGRLRVAHPGDTLAELAARAGVSKDAIAGRLRRLLIAAQA